MAHSQISTLVTTLARTLSTGLCLASSATYTRGKSLGAALVAVSVCLHAGANAAELEPPVSPLVEQFWQAADDAARANAAQALLATEPAVRDLFRQLAGGVLHRANAPTGVVLGSRQSKSGLEMRYAILVPDTYDSTRRYPVEFILHGGVGRPAWGEDEEFWRGGYESLASEDRITVVPAAWRDAMWWQDEQAENLPAILRRVKRDYNVDDNRVTLTGVSDGGTGAYFFAFKQPTPWAAFLPYIGNAAVLRNPQSGGGYRLYFENLRDKPLYIVNGENDPLYPAASIQPFVDVLGEAKVNYQYTVIEGGGHNLNWMPEYAERIEFFKRAYPRDALPDVLQWVADRTDAYNRNHWLVVDTRSEFGRPAVITASRDQNTFSVDTSGVDKFTLLLSPSEIDFDAPITVVVNGEEKFSARVEERAETLLKWAQRDLDRLMLFSAELPITLSGETAN